MHGGIFHSFCSFTVTFLVGECITGAGGDGGPLGIFLLILQFDRTELLGAINIAPDRVSLSQCFPPRKVTSSRDSLEFRRFQGIDLSLHHSDDPLLRARVERLPLLRGRVSNVLSRRLLLRAPHRHSSRYLRSRYLLQRLPGLLGELVDLVGRRTLQARILFARDFRRQQVAQLAVDDLEANGTQGDRHELSRTIIFELPCPWRGLAWRSCRTSPSPARRVEPPERCW